MIYSGYSFVNLRNYSKSCIISIIVLFLPLCFNSNDKGKRENVPVETIIVKHSTRMEN